MVASARRAHAAAYSRPMRDANGQALSHVDLRGWSRAAIGSKILLSKNEARRMTANVVLFFRLRAGLVVRQAQTPQTV
jgi:hypothetical protein